MAPRSKMKTHSKRATAQLWTLLKDFLYEQDTE